MLATLPDCVPLEQLEFHQFHSNKNEEFIPEQKCPMCESEALYIISEIDEDSLINKKVECDNCSWKGDL